MTDAEIGVAESAEGNRPRESMTTDAEIADLTTTISARMTAPIPDAAPNESADLLRVYLAAIRPYGFEAASDRHVILAGLRAVRDAALTEAAEVAKAHICEDYDDTCWWVIEEQILALREGEK